MALFMYLPGLVILYPQNGDKFCLQTGLSQGWVQYEVIKCRSIKEYEVN